MGSLDAQEAFNIFYPIVTSEARDMLRRLAEWPTMKDAWAELPHFQKVTPSNLVTITLMAWLSAKRVELRRRRYAPPPLPTDQAADSATFPFRRIGAHRGLDRPFGLRIPRAGRLLIRSTLWTRRGAKTGLIACASQHC